MIVNVYRAILFFIFLITSASALELTEGVTSRGANTVRNNVQKNASPIITQVVNENGGKPGRGLAYTNFDLGDSWYRLYSDLVIIGVNTQEKTLLGRWPLSRWEHQYISPLAVQQYANINASYPPEFNLEINSTGVGCLAKTPLRYGDIENDDENELVLILGGLFVVFSPEHEQITFSEYLEERDLLHPELHQRKYGDDVPAEAQFVSNLAFINGYPISPAMRFYAKVYVGDFNDNGNSDILVWRKGYLSSRGDDAIDGFVLKAQSWSHYERDLDAQAESEAGTTGEYLPQQTTEADIQNWLSENDLTWSKGYPSKSECAGEEGQLIPEMHDSLLNDPDVLQ